MLQINEILLAFCVVPIKCVSVSCVRPSNRSLPTKLVMLYVLLSYDYC